MASRSLDTFNHFHQTHLETTLGGLRYDAFNEDQNGAKEVQVFPKKGRRRYVDEDRYYLWLELRNTGELDAVICLIRQAKANGGYVSPADAVAKVRGCAK